MDNSKDIAQHITTCVQQAIDEICSNDASRAAMSKTFMDLFQANLTTAINVAYFGDGEQREVDIKEAGLEPDQEAIECENLLLQLINKRKNATKLCNEALQKVLEVEKKTVMALQVAPGVGVTTVGDKFIRDAGPGTKRDVELKMGAKKVAEYVKDTTKRAVELDCRAEDLFNAALIFKEAIEADTELDVRPPAIF